MFTSSSFLIWWDYKIYWPKFRMFCNFSFIIITIIIIIIMSCHQHGYPWPSLATHPYLPLLPTGLQGYIPFRHRAAVCRFKLVVLPLFVHLKGSTGVHHLWAHPYFSSMSESSNFDSLHDGWKVSVQLLLCGLLPPGLVQYCS